MAAGPYTAQIQRALAGLLAGDNTWTGTNTFSGSVNVQFADGSATAPSITFDTDTNTGLYLVAADQLGITTGGVLRGTWSSAGLNLGALDLSAGSVTIGNETLTDGGAYLNLSGGLVAAGEVRGTNLRAGAGNSIYWDGKTEMVAPAAGRITVTSITTGFGSRLHFDVPDVFQVLALAGGADTATITANQLAATGAVSAPKVGGITSAPSIAGNGTLVANSTDVQGKVLSTVTAGATITLTFGTPFAVAPSCSGSNETTANLMRFTSTTTTLTITGVTVTGDSISYSCIGR